MAKKKNKKVEETQVVKETPIVEEVAVVEEAPVEETVEKEEEVVKEPEVIEEVSREKKSLEGAKAREEMKQAWQRRLRGDSMTNLYSYNIGSLL